MQCVRILLTLCVLVAAVAGLPRGKGGWNGNRNGNGGTARGKQLQNGGNGGAARGKQLQGSGRDTHMPWDYNFQWQVDDEEYQNYYGQQETGQDSRVDGSYFVWLPDNRIMRVTYYVDGDSGFVPTITYEDNYQPAWGTPGFQRR